MDKINDNKHYRIDEVFNLLGEENLIGEKRGPSKGDMEIDGYMVHPRSLRYMVFYQKGVVCCKCGCKGSYFKLDKESKDYDGNRRHFNLYTEDGILMTKDHILPRSKGGRDVISNMQTMCTICNFKKGNRIEE